MEPSVTFNARTDKKPKEATVTSASSNPLVNTSERMRMLLRVFQSSSLEELSKDEEDTVRSLFSSIVKEGEHISNSFDLRVLLGDCGLYPPEEELALLLTANLNRIGLNGLFRYLQFYKKEYQIDLLFHKAQAEAQREAPQKDGMQAFTFSPCGGGGGGGQDDSALSVAERVHLHRGIGDEDTLLAFVALGGGEDGSGEVSASKITDMIRDFNLTVDLASVIDAIDVHHSGALDYYDFCQVVCGSGGARRGMGDRGSFSALDAASPMHGLFTGNTTPPGGRAGTMVNGINLDDVPESHRQILSTLASGRRESSLWRTIRQSRASIAALNYAAKTAAATGVPPALVGAPGTGSAPAKTVRTLESPLHTQPISEEEHKVLLYYFLYPEEYARQVAAMQSANQRRLKFSSGNDTGGAAGTTQRRSTAHNGGSGTGGAAGSRSASASGKRRRGAAADDDDEDDPNAYRPPSPMILSQRNTTRYRNENKARAELLASSRSGKLQEEMLRTVAAHSQSEKRAVLANVKGANPAATAGPYGGNRNNSSSSSDEYRNNNENLIATTNW